MNAFVVLPKTASVLSERGIRSIGNVLKHLWYVGVQWQLAHIPRDAGLMLLGNLNQVQIVRNSDFNGGVIQEELSPFAVPARVALDFHIAVSASFAEILEVGEVAERREVRHVHGVLNDQGLISHHKVPDLGGGGVLQADHRHRFPAGDVPWGEAQALIGRPGPQQATGETAAGRLPLLFEAPSCQETTGSSGLFQGSAALQIQKEVFNLNIAALAGN
mmetsp:Transcript_55627/g.133095  ORF Transcript_55627/g.133095 Transcript_55627/m.133095 type:complete len:218 (-) Transcript_55627:673-1326(-)